MKRFLISLCFIPLILAGCAYNESVSEPEITSTQQLLTLPDAEATLEKSSSFSKKIDGTAGGVIDFNYFYKSGGQSVSVHGYLDIPPGAFDNTQKITLILSKTKAIIDLFPSPLSFNVPLNLTIIYNGLDLGGLTPDKLNYFYIGTAGYENVEYSEKLFDSNTGTLGIIDAKLYHFSRYGWVY